MSTDPLECIARLDLAAHWAGIVPTGRYFSLVSAAVGPGDPLPFWGDYLDRLGAVMPDEGETRLYPFVARRLGDGLATAACGDRLEGSRRSTIMQTTRLLRTAAMLSQSLNDASIPFIFSKGLALTARVYRRPDMRRFADIDVHVPEAHVAGVLALASASGWSVKGLHRAWRAEVIAAIAETTFITPDGDEIDIHWRPRRSFAWLPDWTERFAQSRRTVQWRDADWPIPSDTWLLIETIEHGLKFNDVSPIRWVVDAFSLLSCSDVEIDWDVIAAAGEAARIRPALHLGLAILSALDAPMPEDVPARFGWTPGRLERATFRWRMRPRSTAMTAIDETLHYLLRGPGTPFDRIIALPGYIRADSFEYPRWRDLWWRFRHGARHR